MLTCFLQDIDVWRWKLRKLYGLRSVPGYEAWKLEGTAKRVTPIGHCEDHAWSNAVAVTVVKKSYFATIIASLHLIPWAFSNSTRILTIWLLEVEGEHSVAHCDWLANYFTGKIDSIRLELDTGLIIQSLDVLSN